MKNRLEALESWISKKTNVNVEYFRKGTFWLLITNIFLGVSSLLITWALANFLSKEDYGFYQFFLAVLAIVGITALPGTRTALTVGIAKKKFGTYMHLIKKKLPYSFFGVLGLLLTSAYFFHFRNGDYWEIFFFAALIFPIYDSFKIFFDYHTAKKDFRKYSFLQISRRVITWVPILIIFIFYKNIYMIIFLYLIIQTIFNLFGHFDAKKDSKKNNDIEQGSFKYSLEMTFNHGLNILAQHVDKVILTYYFGLANLATYALMKLIGDEFKSFVGIFKTLIFPKYSEMKAKAAYEVVKNKWLFVFGANIVLVIIAVLIVDPFIKVFFPKFIEIIPYTQLLLAFYIFQYLSTFISTYFLAQKASGIITGYTVSLNVMKVLAFIVLIPMYGLLGGVLAIIAGEVYKIIYMGISFVFYGKKYF